MSERIGFTGLGVMGDPWRGIFLRAAFDVVVHSPHGRGPVESWSAGGRRRDYIPRRRRQSAMS